MARFVESDKKMSPEDRKALESRYKSMVLSASGKELDLGEDGIHLPDRMQNRRTITNESIRLKRVLDKDASLVAVDPEERRKLSERMNWIAGHLRDSAPTVAEVNRTIKSSGHADFERAVQKSMYWQGPEVMKLIEEWKQIKNRLEPDDPTADDVMILGETASTHYMGGQSVA